MDSQKSFYSEFIRRCKRGKVVLTGWKNTRSWLYIDDCCKAIHKLMNCKRAINQIVNIGSNDEKKVIDVAKIILKQLGITKPIIKNKAPAGSAKRRVPDIKKLKKLIKWVPSTKLEENQNYKLYKMIIGIIGLGVVGSANKYGFEKIGHKVLVRY